MREIFERSARARVEFWFRCGFSCLLALLLPDIALAACPRSNTLAARDGAISYKLRGDRCEGIYATPVSTSSRPKIIGFHRHGFSNAPFSGVQKTSLAIAAAARPTSLSVRAVSLRPKTYYAMDTDLPGGKTRFEWATSILSAPSLSMRANELGLLACDNMCLPQAETTYFPVDLLLPPSGSSATGFVIYFQSDVGIVDATLTLQNSEGGFVLTRHLDDRSVGSWAIPVKIGSPKPGRYRMRLVAEATDGTRLSGVYAIVIP